MINRIKLFLIRIYMDFAKIRAIKKANKMYHLTRYKYVVIRWRMGYRVVRKSHLKELWKRKYFNKGVTVAQLEKGAVYTTF